MILPNRGDDSHWNKSEGAGVRRHVPFDARPGRQRPLAKDTDVVGRATPGWPAGGRKQVVIVMDALKEFTTAPLMWALAHIVDPSCMVTLLGIMPWLNLPLSCKTRLDIWTVNLLNLSELKSRPEWEQDGKYQKARAVVDLCERHGVVPYMQVAMGHPQRLLVLERISSLHATWVIFDRHHKKWSSFYRKRIPCNVVMMNPDGGADMLRGMSMLQSGELPTPVESPVAVPLVVPEVIISEKWRGLLKKQSEEQAAEGSETSAETGDIFKC